MQIIKSALKDKYQPLTESGFRRHDDGAVLRTLPLAPGLLDAMTTNEI